jgi:nucleoside-diphosphate-sugar epimerase
LWIDEKTPCKPVGPYEVSKLEAEATLAGLPLKQMRLCMLRPTNVIDEDHPGVLGLALRHSWQDRLALFLKGNEGAHLIHAEDVAAAALHLAEVESCSGRYFVACDEDPLNTVAEAVRTCGQVTGWRKSPSCSLPPGAPYLLRLLTKGKRLHGRSRFSSARIKATGFEFKVGLEQAINRVCRSMRGVKCGF